MTDDTYIKIAVWSQVVASILFVVVLVFLWRRYLTPAVVETARATVAEAERDARSIDARAQSDARALRERIAASAAAEAERLVRNAEGELERSRAAAREALRADLVAKAVAIARHGAKNVDRTTDRRLIDEAVDTAERGSRP